MQLRWQYLLFLFLFGYVGANAQVISGRVLIDSTNKPLAARVITHSGQQTSCNVNGEFMIRLSGIGDTIKVFSIGYRPFFYPVKVIKAELLVVNLKPNIILLNDVLIRAKRNHQKDSLDRRKDYSRVFSYQPPKVTDALGPQQIGVPFAFVSIDLLTLFKALTKNSDPEYKFKKLLLKDEQADYVATRINRGLVTRETGLKGDSLNQFMDKYYPTADWVRKANDYDIIQYIKTKALEFRKGP